MKVNQDKLKIFTKQLKNMSRMKIGIGCVGDHGDGMTNTELMLIHEFGTSGKGGIPARMPIRLTFRHAGNIKILQKTLQHAQETFFKTDKGFNIMAIGAAVGNAMKEMTKGMIRRRLQPQLKDSTLERKKKLGYSSIPLVATGRLLNSIEYEIKK